MTTTNTPDPDSAPDGFWDELGSWLTADKEGRQKVLKLFSERNDAPAPELDDKPAEEEAPKKRKGWFASE